MKAVFKGLTGKHVRINLDTKDSVIGTIQEGGAGEEHVVVIDSEGTKHYVPYAHIVEFFEQPTTKPSKAGFK